MVNTSTSLSIIPRTWNGTFIGQRPNDGYIDATAMCKATGKRFNNWFRNPATQEFLAELDGSTRQSADPMIQTLKGGPNEARGTWIHPKAAINLAQWCSPKFAVKVSDWVFELMTTGSVRLGPPASGLTAEDVVKIVMGMMPLIAKTVSLEVQTVTAPLLEHFAASVRPKSPTGATQQRLGRFIASSLDCRCFSCLQAPVVTKDGMRLRSTEWSRWKGVHRRSISEVWLICADCGLLYRTDPDARIQGDEKFRSFQARRLEWEHLDGMKVLQMEIDYSQAYDED